MTRGRKARMTGATKKRCRRRFDWQKVKARRRIERESRRRNRPR